ncbi:MAG TPA: alanine dehydrogenase [Oscillospiraceae bacterium]|nr:alanine dehydrogenase [Oscillospiraceae bacterium]HPF56391.1 alanine dehydrogenase [Clostridiales bacterium]HPK35103.1 alanine dehydrogenase [Oscillospiraceae bacterium]HPR75254.1 alanine dehydrogenase [Oscillospiraceae bacterium]
MVIGVIKEIKNNEFRVGLTPGGAHVLAREGHTVLVETGAGEGSGFTDAEYIEAGAAVESDKKSIFDRANIIVKVKEPLASEYDLFHEGQTLYTYLHLAPNPPLAKALLDKKVTGIAFETVQKDGTLPLLAPMSEVAGRMSIQVGANYLQKPNGGLGVLLGGVAGVLPAKVVIVGGGTVGTNAAKIALGLGADVTILDISLPRLRYLDDIFGGRLKTLVYNAYNAAQTVKDADLLVGAVLVPGKSAPKIVTADMVKTMKKGSVIVDVAIDQGGSIETIDHATTHDNPTYEKFGVIHYSVANMPGAVPRTSTLALESATMPYLVNLANKGVSRALLEDEGLMKGLNTAKGYMTCQNAADSLGLEYRDPKTLIATL